MMNFSKRMQMLLCSAFTFSLSMWAGDGLTMIVGTYTDTGSTGLYSFMFNQQTGETTLLDSLSMTNPSYLTFAHRPHLLYVVSETNDNHAAVCTVGLNETTGQMRLLNRQLTGGEDPCFVETNGRMVLTANYSGGTMSVFPVLRNGLIGARRYRFAGHADPHATAPQNTAHVHTARFAPNGCVYATDFSADQLLCFKPTSSTSLKPLGVVGRLPRGEAPRHIAFAPNGRYVYVMSELGGAVTMFKRKGYHLERLQTIASDSVGGRGGADVHLSPDGRYLYASNRLKADGISIFKVDATTGMLCKVGYQPTEPHPRNFALTPNGRYLLCACRDGNCIQVFARDAETGLLAIKQTIRLRKPVCIRFKVRN